MNFFITGTDTGVGKTYITTLLIESLRKAGLDTVGMKPICCGDRLDAELLHRASGGSASLNEINPVWLRTPASPYTAAMIENQSIDLDLIKETFTALRASYSSILVEGAGGWLVPIQKNYFISDLAIEFGLPVVVIVENRLGALNHALLTIENIQSKGLICAGIILNNMKEKEDIVTTTNRSVFESISDVPVIFEIEKNQRTLQLGIA